MVQIQKNSTATQNSLHECLNSAETDVYEQYMPHKVTTLYKLHEFEVNEDIYINCKYIWNSIVLPNKIFLSLIEKEIFMIQRVGS